MGSPLLLTYLIVFEFCLSSNNDLGFNIVRIGLHNFVIPTEIDGLDALRLLSLGRYDSAKPTANL